jgi:hypothetical protein
MPNNALWLCLGQGRFGRVTYTGSKILPGI